MIDVAPPAAPVTRDLPGILGDLADREALSALRWPDALDDELLHLEIKLYVSLEQVAERAAALTLRATAAGRTDAALRAELVRSDALSRAGDLEAALAIQRAITDQARDGGASDLHARARCYAASTFWRLGLRAESQDAAGDGLRLLSATAPALWHVEHHMVFALFTSYDRAGAQLELLEETLRRARALGEPTMLLAVLNNHAWIAHQSPAHRDRAWELAQEMTAIIQARTAIASAAVLDTLGWLELERGNLARAEELLDQALTLPLDVEPDGHAAIMLHLAAIRRRQGRPREATALLERARAIALGVKAPEYAVDALPELAELDAERGDFRRAYRRLHRHLRERDRAEREESERRAALLQSMHISELERDRRHHLEQLAARDPLTDLYNRRHLEQELPILLAAGAVSIAMIDVDHFKQINDRHSHEVGDAVLVGLARILESHRRQMSPDGFTVRLGGEEFLIVVPLGAAEARAGMERLRAAIAAHAWSGVPADVHPTVSIGLTTGDARSDTRSSLLARADDLLYRAKRDGRDRLVHDGP